MKDHVQTCQKYDDEDDIELLRPLRKFRRTLPSLVLLKGLLAASGSVLKKTPGALRTQWTEYEIPELGSHLKPLPTPNESRAIHLEESRKLCLPALMRVERE